MLKFLRKKNVAKMIFWALLVLILPAFVLWGTGAIGGSKKKGPAYVGKVANKKISFDDLGSHMLSIRSQIILNYFNQPQIMDAFLKNEPFLAKLAWDRIIMLNEANKRKVKVSDTELIMHIRSHPIFTRGGVFDDRIYGYVLRNNMGLSPRTFEEMMRENMKIQKMNDLLTKDVTVNDEEIVDAYLKEKGVEKNKMAAEDFNKTRDEYAKKALTRKKNKRLEDWLRDLEAKTVLNIDFDKYDEYFK